MSREMIAQVIKETTGVSKTLANATVSNLISEIARSLKREGKFALVGFGTLKVARRAARKGRNPATGAQIKIKASKTIRFKPSGTLRRSI